MKSRLQRELERQGVACVFTRGALDKVVWGPTPSGRPVRMMSELREGDHFREFSPDGPIEVAGGDAYRAKVEGGMAWCVPMRRDRKVP